MKKQLFTLIICCFSFNLYWAQDYEHYRKLIDTTIHSACLGYEKKITVTVPYEWQAGSQNKFPLIIVFDQQNKRSHQYILQTIDYLTSNQQMPASIILSIESEQQYRYLETLHKASDSAGKAFENERFLFEELIPLAERSFNASSFRIFIGHSRYGYFTTSLLKSRINQLNAVISLSPFFTQKNVNLMDSLASLQRTEFTNTNYYRYAIGNDYPDDFYAMDSTLKTITIPTFNASGQLFIQADHNATPGLIIAPALYEIFEFWSERQANFLRDTTNSLNYSAQLEEEITAHYGTSFDFALGILNGKGWTFFNEGAFEHAINTWKLLLNNYPNFSEAYLYILEAEIALKDNHNLTIEAFHQSLKNSKLYSDAEKQELLIELERLKSTEEH